VHRGRISTLCKWRNSTHDILNKIAKAVRLRGHRSCACLLSKLKYSIQSIRRAVELSKIRQALQRNVSHVRDDINAVSWSMGVSSRMVALSNIAY
jgi:hypothetical protein